MKSSNATWDLGRFVKTLSYFGAIPFLSNFDWFQQLLGNRPAPTVNRSTLTKLKTVLVVGAPAPLQQKLVQNLETQGYQVRSQTSPQTPNTQTPTPNAVICWAQEGQNLAPMIEAMTESIAQSPDTSGQLVFDFSQPTEALQDVWGALDDVVMGGVSESNMQILNNVALFAGTVSTANSGGFASVRTRNFDPPLDLANADGVELRVKGDGNRYKFMLRSETRWDGIAYCYSFDTLADQWITVRIPFDALIPVFRAKTVSSAGRIDPHQITAFQLMLSKFEYDGALNPSFSPGSFQLQIESIRTYASGSLSRLVVLSTSEATLHEQQVVLQQRDIPYTIVQTAALVDEVGGRSLVFNPADLSDKTMSYADLAELCVWAIAHPQACRTQFSVATGNGLCAPRDWECLFKTL
jgi:hypothetical protein